jgi:hypothetical protein
MSGRRIVDDEFGLPGHVGLESTTRVGYLGRHGGDGRLRSGHGVERAESVADEIKGARHLAMPKAPTDVLVDNIREAGAFLTILVSGIRPTLDGLGDVLNAHRKMKPVEHVMCWTGACRLSQVTRPVDAVTEDGSVAKFVAGCE